MDAKEAKIFGMEHVEAHPEIKGWYVYDSPKKPGCPHAKKDGCDIQDKKPRWCVAIPIFLRKTEEGYKVYCLARCVQHLMDNESLQKVVDLIKSVPEILEQSHRASLLLSIPIEAPTF